MTSQCPYTCKRCGVAITTAPTTREFPFGQSKQLQNAETMLRYRVPPWYLIATMPHTKL